MKTAGEWHCRFDKQVEIDVKWWIKLVNDITSSWKNDNQSPMKPFLENKSWNPILMLLFSFSLFWFGASFVFNVKVKDYPILFKLWNWFMKIFWRRMKIYRRQSTDGKDHSYILISSYLTDLFDSWMNPRRVREHRNQKQSLVSSFYDSMESYITSSFMTVKRTNKKSSPESSKRSNEKFFQRCDPGSCYIT